MQMRRFPEARAFYGFQSAIENVHSEMYGLLAGSSTSRTNKNATFYSGRSRRCPACRKRPSGPSGGSSRPRASRSDLVAFACVEGIHFSGSFCSIYWLKKRLLMPGLDVLERAHLARRGPAHRLCVPPVLAAGESTATTSAGPWMIVDEAVALEREFCCEALSVSLVGMNAGQMARVHRVRGRQAAGGARVRAACTGRRTRSTGWT